MTCSYKVDFNELDWQSPIEGLSQKNVDRNDLRLRLVRYSEEMPPHWCEKGHFGYLLEGRMEIEFECETIDFEAGDALSIPDGPEHRHRGKVVSPHVLVLFVERIDATSVR